MIGEEADGKALCLDQDEMYGTDDETWSGTRGLCGRRLGPFWGFFLGYNYFRLDIS